MSSGREGLFANVTEVMVNGPDDVYVERGGETEQAGDGLSEGAAGAAPVIDGHRRDLPVIRAPRLSSGR